MRCSSNKFVISKKDSFLQYTLWRANPISNKRVSTGEIGVILTPQWWVGCEEGVGSSGGANRLWISAHAFSTCTFGCRDKGTDHPSYTSSGLCALFTGLWVMGPRGHWRECWMCGRGDEGISEWDHPAQDACSTHVWLEPEGTNVQPLSCEQSSGMLSAPITYHKVSPKALCLLGQTANCLHFSANVVQKTWDLWLCQRK